MNSKIKTILKKKEKNFLISLHEQIDPLSDNEWNELFVGYPEPYQMIKLTQDIFKDDFEFYSLTVQYEGKTIVYFPFFISRYDLANFLDGKPATIVKFASKALPQLSPKILGIGFVEGEWLKIGINRKVESSILNKALTIGFEMIEEFAQSKRVDIITLINTDSEYNEHFRDSYTIETPSYGRLNINYRDLNEYLNSLPADMKKYVVRKTRCRNNIKVIKTTNPSPWLDDLYKFYSIIIQNSDLYFATLPKTYYEGICKTVPGAYYNLYFENDDIIGFNLLLEGKDYLLDKYFAMEPEAGRKNGLYFVSWLENVEYCIKNNITTYYAGLGAQDVKKKLGCTMRPNMITFKPKNFVIAGCVNFLRNYVADSFNLRAQND